MASGDGFRLQSVLDYRTSMVNLREAEFVQVQRKYQREREVLANLKRVQQRERSALRAQQQGALDPTMILLRQEYVQHLEKEMEQQRQRLIASERELEARRSKLVEALKEKKMLESLRTRYEIKRQEAARRREARMIDEIVTARYGRTNASP